MTRNKVAFVPAVLLLCLAACASINPLGYAESAEQKAYALYGTFVVFEEQAAKAYADPVTPVKAKQALSRADRVAKPAVDALMIAAREVIRLRRDYDAGKITKDNFIEAVDRLEALYEQTRPAVEDLVAAVKEN